MAEDDLERQIDEIAALSSIYSDKCRVIDEASRIYAIEVSEREDNPKLILTLQIQFPENYPSKAPPHYQLSAPWLRGLERQEICNALDDIYLENLGESIIYLWIEHLHQYLAERGSSQSDQDPEDRLLTEESLISTSCDLEEDRSEESHIDDSLLEKMATCAVVPEAVGQENQCPEIFHGECLKDKKSVFQAHLAKVTHPNQIKLVMDKLCESKKIAEATHRIQAYRIVLEKNGRELMHQGCVDDGEIHAGSRMLHLMQIVQATNVLVVVTRRYGGIHLGPDRFKHINNLTRQILVNHGFIKEKEEKKGSKKTKKGRKS